MYHKNNYPDVNSRRTLFKDKYLVVSPVARDENDMKSHFNRNDGVIILDDSSDDTAPNVSRYLKCDDDDDVNDGDCNNDEVPQPKSRNRSHAHEEDIELPDYSGKR